MSNVVSFIIRAVNQTMHGLDASKQSIQRFTMWAKTAMLGVMAVGLVRKFGSAIDEVVKKARETGDFSLIKEEDVTRLERMKERMEQVKLTIASAGATVTSKFVGAIERAGAFYGALFSGSSMNEATKIADDLEAEADSEASRKAAVAATEKRVREEQALDHEAHMKGIRDRKEYAAMLKRIREEEAKDHEAHVTAEVDREHDRAEAIKRIRADEAADYKNKLESEKQLWEAASSKGQASVADHLNKAKESRDLALHPEKGRAAARAARDEARNDKKFERLLQGALKKETMIEKGYSRNLTRREQDALMSHREGKAATTEQKLVAGAEAQVQMLDYLKKTVAGK